jgi:hypothetical protein
VEVIVGEPVPTQAQLPGQGPLAEPFSPGGGVLADGNSVSQQAGIRGGAVALAVPWRVVWRG